MSKVIDDLPDKGVLQGDEKRIERETYISNFVSPISENLLKEGHKFEIVGKVDVWYKVKWNDNTAFVKDHSLLPVSL